MNEPESRLTIEEVLDLETGEIIESKDFFKQSEDKLIQFRRIQQKAINNNTAPKFVCPYCYQILKISGKATQRGMVSYFAHLYDSDECEIKTNGSYSLEEIEALKYAGVKESQRHIDLKGKLYQFLKAENSQKLLIENVKLEKRLNSENTLLNWRRPDVYAEYNHRKIVFELQLSTTFLSVIVARDNFYKLNETYIIWIFNFSDNTAFVNLGNLMCKDIYYANKRNAFILDNEAIRLSEQEKELVLLCKWFEPVVKDGKVIANKEKQEYIKLSNLQFDDSKFKPYYIDADNLFLKYNPEQLITRKNQEIEQEKWLKIVEAKAIERTNKKEALRALKIEKIKKDLLQDKYKLKPIEVDNKWGYKANGEIIVPPIYDYVYPPNDYGYAMVRNESKIGYINKIGRLVERCIHYDRLVAERKISRIKHEDFMLKIRHKAFKWIKNDLTGLTNENDVEIVPFIYDVILEFDDGKAKAQRNGKWGYVNISGNEFIPCVYDDLDDFKDGLYKVKKNDLFGFIDGSGNQVIPCLYNSLWDFKNDIAPVSKNGLYGYINRKGEEIIPCIYNDAMYFVDGRARTKKNSLWGYIDIQGNEIIPWIYEEMKRINNEFYKVKYKNKWGYIDYLGKTVVKIIYDELGDFNENVTEIKLKDKIIQISGLAKYKSLGKRGYVNKSGREYWQYWKE